MITESKRFLFDEEIHQLKQTVLGDNFPWYFQPSSTSNKFHFFSHGHQIFQLYEQNLVVKFVS